ncbi:signal transduction histidine kinase [Larkinella arboricola]|uniref:histidine kinase n=1 Tax=Larkinella arboricola TaxID=643671 RepID=A0A327WLG3_LARAB|nr:ATP-binding protein [Larkinella arboricola]RAJ91091.1 signal transduction histidine kinase [Larkinella arboricola]
MRVRLLLTFVGVVLRAFGLYGQTGLVLPLDSLAQHGIRLEKGWKWQAGDNPHWSQPTLNDSAWHSIDPTISIHELPQVRKAGVSWFRLRVSLPARFPASALSLAVSQVGASEIFLDGKRIERYGLVSVDPAVEQTYNPHNRPIPLPALSAGQHLLAIRYSFLEQNGYLNYAGFGNACLTVWLLPSPMAWDRFLYSHEIWNIQSIPVFGILLMLCILHFCFYFLYPARKVNLRFAQFLFFFSFSMLGDPLYFQLHGAGDQFWNALLWFLLVIGNNVCLLRAIYELLEYPKGRVYYRLVGLALLGLPAVFLSYDWGWFYCTFFLLTVVFGETIRISIRSLSTKKREARVIIIGQLLVIIFFVVQGVIQASTDINSPMPPLLEGLFRVSYSASFLTIPILVTLLLAGDFAKTSHTLEAKLAEVQALSARTLVQEQEKQQLLASQNQLLEQQVAQRTAELRAQTLELQVAQEQLRQADAQKTRFFDNLTHEFRTPLTLILAPVDRLLGHLQDQQARKDLQTVERNARTLLGLINQLLDITKLEAQTMPLTVSAGDLIAHTERLLDQFRPLAREKQIRLTFQAQELAGQWWYDAEKWQKILFNLLSNALKFTPAGGAVSVELERISSQEHTQQVQLTVRDTGVGISTQHQPHIFDRFYQADNSWTRHHEGSGIGLALVKELTELMNGQIEVSSQPRDTTFRLIIPLQAVETPVDTLPVSAGNGPEKAHLSASVADAANQELTIQDETVPLVLVVEDNAELRDFLATDLSATYRVLTATNGQEGWETACRELPDLVLSDVMMPLMDGYTLTDRLKSDPSTDHIAVVLLTARSAYQHVVEGLQRGADEYLPKPFHLEELRLRLHNLLTRQNRLKEHYQQQFASLPEQKTGQSANGAEEPVPHPFLEKIDRVLEEHLDNPQLSVDWLADHLAMSRKTLYRKVVSLTPWTPNELIRRYRLRRGADLLVQGHSVAEAAYQVGFEIPAYFGQCFKEVYRATPSDYVKMIQAASSGSTQLPS